MNRDRAAALVELARGACRPDSMHGTGPGRVDASELSRCLRDGHAVRVTVNGLWRYRITDAGRRALADHQHREGVVPA